MRIFIIKTHIDKTSAKISHAAHQFRSGAGVYTKQNGHRSSDIRQGSSAIQLIQSAANNSRQVAQLQKLQELANVSQRVAQRNESLEDLEEPAQLKRNDTGLPDNLKNGMESMTGHSLDNVQVHYNSPKPAQLHAHAYAQGNDIHLGSGQQHHLAHELGHVVQQIEGRVQPTMSVDGVAINDNAGLEKEADMLGDKALRTS